MPESWNIAPRCSKKNWTTAEKWACTPNLLSLRKILENCTTQVANFFCQNLEILFLDVQKHLFWITGKKWSCFHSKFVEFEEDFRKLHYSGGQFSLPEFWNIVPRCSKTLFLDYGQKMTFFHAKFVEFEKDFRKFHYSGGQFFLPESWNIAPRCSKKNLDYGWKMSLFWYQICLVWGRFQKFELLRWPNKVAYKVGQSGEFVFAWILKYCA